MKKFLFTLAALLMCGSAFAENYLYVDGFEVAENQLGSEIEVIVKAHFDNRVSAFDAIITMPEGMETVDFEIGSDMKGMEYYNQRGRVGTIDAAVTTLDNEHFIGITSATTTGYYQDEEGNWVPYLAIKWEPGDYEEFMILYVEVAEDFKGGDITVVTKPACGEDPRGNTCPKGEEWTKTATVTVEGGAVVPEVTDKPVITYVVDEEAQTVTVTATGNGHICLYWDDMLQAEGEGAATWVIPFGDEEEEYGISATAQEDGKEISEYALATIVVPAKVVVPPTPMELTGEVVISEPDANGIVTVTYTGNEDVTVTVTVNGVPVEGEIQLEEGENEIVVTVTADGYETLVVTEKVTYTPAGPVEDSYVLVVIDQNNVEHYFNLNKGADGNYTTTLTLDYNPYFQFEWDKNLSDEENKAAHPVPFYFLINGKRYSADGVVPTVMGYAMENPLVNGEDGFYTVPVGNAYTLGLAIYGEEYYVYAAVANPTGVDELVNGKAVAGVRYFNMAGQEMKEANGMTIVVTTYTDGTTSATKVMK